jgi:hypothetical protein
MHHVSHFVPTKLAGRDSGERLPCSRCHSQPAFMFSMLDSARGRTVRMFECQCGEQIWTADSE